MTTINDHFSKASNGTAPIATTLSSQKAMGAGSLSLNASTGWDTTTPVHFLLYQVNASNELVAGTLTIWKGLLAGTTVSSLTLKSGTDTIYPVGSVVELAFTSAMMDDLVAGLQQSLNPDGSLIPSAVQTALGIVNVGAGWTPLGFSPNTITANGNRSYSIVFNGNDLTSTLSPGMRLQLTRTVASPTQCTSLNGTTQYYSKTSPAGMTFTDDFVVSAWVKLSSYPSGDAGIVSRWNGTNGWGLDVKNTGQVQLFGTNAGAGNSSYVVSYQSLPLNKWVHIAAQLDMSAFTATPTTSYIMFDGLDVPSSVGRAGTNPTALIQAGNLEIGSQNATAAVAIKISQVAIYSAKVTQATILASMNQTLAGTETSLISAYSFNNSISDLNANANNLTANGSAVATNADSPFSINSFGTATGTTDYGIVTKATFSTNTTVVVQVPEANTIPTTGGITSVSYATVKVPYGFPSQIGKWRIKTISIAAAFQSSPTQNVWYNIGSLNINIPIGEWMYGYETLADVNKTGSGTFLNSFVTLSNVNNAAGALEITSRVYMTINSAINSEIASYQTRESELSLSSATIYYLNYLTDSPGIASIGTQNNNQATTIYAECAYI